VPHNLVFGHHGNRVIYSAVSLRSPGLASDGMSVERVRYRGFDPSSINWKTIVKPVSGRSGRSAARKSAAPRKPSKLWSALKPATQKRKLSGFRKQGLTDGQIRARYNAGTLGPQSAVRGHGGKSGQGLTPEHPREANPIRHREYLQRSVPSPEQRRAANQKYLDYERWLKGSRSVTGNRGIELDSDDNVIEFNVQAGREFWGDEDTVGRATSRNIDDFLKKSFDELLADAKKTATDNKSRSKSRKRRSLGFYH
jgi:hypothetical protein